MQTWATRESRNGTSVMRCSATASERALGGLLPLLADETHAASQVLATLTGFGVLQPYFDDPGVEEIWINAPEKVFIARDGVPEFTGLELTPTEVRDLVERMLQFSGRRVDLSSPFVDSSLPTAPDCTWSSRISPAAAGVSRSTAINLSKVNVDQSARPSNWGQD